MEGGRGGGGVLRVLTGGNELEWEMRRTGWGGSTGCIMHRVHTNKIRMNQFHSLKKLNPCFHGDEVCLFICIMLSWDHFELR